MQITKEKISNNSSNKILVIQTAFIGDVILATSILENLHSAFPNISIDFLLRKGNETLFEQHPYINKIWIWNKKEKKYKNLFKIIRSIRKERYDIVINAQRYFASGLITALSAAKYTVGFNKNPLSFIFNKKIKHTINDNNEFVHEAKRNVQLITEITHINDFQIKLYPNNKDFEAVQQYKNAPYICIAPTSVWFTKQYPAEKWIEFLNHSVTKQYKVFLIGAPNDQSNCDALIEQSTHKNITNLCGKLSFLSSCALLKDSVMNYVNDSAPLHMASAVNASVTAIFCSTIPAFGFGPLSEKSLIVETKEKLKCRPCGLHGYKSCPEKNFSCAHKIKLEQLLQPLNY